MDAPTATGRDAPAFDDLDRTLQGDGPGAALDRLIALLEENGDARALLDALLLKARHELGLPLIHSGGVSEIPEPTRSQFEERYVEAIRTVGARLLAAGEIAAAWPYFRALGEKEAVAEAIEGFEADEADDRLGAVIEVAFNEGAHPRRGFDLILEHYGICSAISAFEHLPPDESLRKACAGRLVRDLHAQLSANLRAEVARRGQPSPAASATIPDLLAGRDWLFDDDAYHIDVSHLAAVVRIAPSLEDPDELAKAVELTAYGRRLSDRLRYEGEPPFDRLYEDHAVYLGGLLGRDLDAAIDHFRAKLTPPGPDGLADLAETLAAQVLVRMLVRSGRTGEALDLAAEHLAGLPESTLICPGVAQLCQAAGRPDRLARIARDRGDLVHYAAAILQAGPPPST